MTAVLDRVVPSRRREKDRVRQVGDSHDSRFGDVTISAPHQGGWSHPGAITQLKNEWDMESSSSITDNSMSPVDGMRKEYDQVIIVDDNFPPQDLTRDHQFQEKNGIAFQMPLHAKGGKRSHSRNGSLANEHTGRTESPVRAPSTVSYKPVRDTYMQEYAHMSNSNSNVGPWNYVQDNSNREQEMQRHGSPQNWHPSPANSPPPLTNSSSDTTPASIEFTRSNAGSPSLSMLSPVSEDFAKDDPRHHELAEVGMTPLPSRTPQPPHSQSPPTSDSDDYQWQALPSQQQTQFSSDEDRPQQRLRNRSVSRKVESGVFARSRSVDVPDYGRGTPPLQAVPSRNGRRTPSVDMNPMAAGPYSGPAWDPSIRSRSPATFRPGTADSLRSSSATRMSHSNIYTFDRASTVNIFNQDYMMTPAEYEKLYNERMKARSVVQDRAPSVEPASRRVSERAPSVEPGSRRLPDRAPSVGPRGNGIHDRDATPVPRGRLRSRSASRNQEDDEEESGTSRQRSTSRAREASRLRNYMTFDDLDPHDVPLPASRPGSRPASRAASQVRDRAMSLVRDRASSRLGHRDPSRGRDAFARRVYMPLEEPEPVDLEPHSVPLPPSRPGSRAPSLARDRAQSRNGRRESSRPRATSRNAPQRFVDTNGYYDASDADINTSSGEEMVPLPPLPPSRIGSRRPSIAANTMSSQGTGANSFKRDDFQSEVKREAEYLVRMMQGDAVSVSEDSDLQSVKDSGGKGQVMKGKRNQLVPEDEDLWG